ncbi:MAG: type VI secretion system tip protein VgrG [Myxococcales bacterium]|nr:type VI secretion system tip protein VgrG [Myxococcales bacterium]
MPDFKQDNLGLKVSTPFGDNIVLVQALRGEDRVSGLFHYQLELVSEDPALDMATIISQPVTVTISHNGGEHYLNGLCTRFVQAGTSARFTTYYAELRPWLYMTTLAQDTRIFQEMSTPDIIKQVFDDLGWADYKLETTGSYQPRVYCVQYQETCFNFVSRLMEDEGIFYYFTHEDGKHTMVIADANSAFKPGPAVTEAKVKPQDGSGKPGDDIITRFALEEQVTVGKYAMTDYNFEKPSTALNVKVDGDQGKHEVYEFPGGYMVKGDGEGRVKWRIEEMEAPVKLVKGQSFCRGFFAGGTVTVSEHVREDLNDEYVFKWVSHNLTQSSYSNTFEAFPKATVFRPARLSRKPKVYGIQTAMVTGKSGEEIYTDKYGRIKVQFHWDREGKKDENTTCWIRVAQIWAGKGWGAWWLPRIGQEVVITFLEGDPDRPLCTGSVYNAETTVPYSLPGDATKSTIKSESSKGGGGYNEIRFEDKKDSEEIWIHAQKDKNVVILNDHTRKVGNDETITINQNRTVLIEEADETFTVAKGNRTMEVSKGNETYSVVKGKRDVLVGDNETHTNKANFTHDVKGNYKLTIKGNLTIEVTGDISIKTKKGWTAEASMDMTNKAGMNMTNKAGMNMTNKAGINLTNDAGVEVLNKGTMATLKGSAMATVKGGVVMIN